MTKRPELRAINCTNCGAGLELIGGGRVTTHVCGYCGSVLDALKDYRVLKRFANLKRPVSPFAIGMEGKLWGVPFRIIGTLAEEERHRGRTWTWVDHLLFSPTHGYVWLTVEDGHLVWTRQHRKAVSPQWLDEMAVEIAEQPPTVSSDGETFKYYETSTSEITFVEGEFTWRPMVGDRSVTVTAMSDRHMLHFTQTSAEREVQISGYLPRAETLAAFGTEAMHGPRGVHPLQPFKAGPNDGFLMRAAAVFGGVCLIGALAMAMTGRPILPPTPVPPGSMPAEVVIPVDEPGRLVRLDITGDVQSGWAWIELGLTDPDDAPVFVAGREVGYYTGYDEGTWVEDTRRTRLTFRPEKAGPYTLEIAAEEAGLGEGDTPDAPIPGLTVSAMGGLGSPFWLLLGALLFGGVAAWKMAARYTHRAARWRGSDWTED